MWTIPNIMTMGRICVLPLILYLIWPGVETRETCFWAGIIYAISGILDIVDGAIARLTNSVTTFGKFLDPLADKIFHLVTLVALLQLPGPRIPVWVVSVFIIRELAVTGLRAIAASEGMVIAAGDSGKVKTTFGTIGTVGLLMHYTYIIDWGPFSTAVSLHRVGLAFTYISVLYSISSAITYARSFIRVHNASGNTLS
jgi:CDP-diacylglycerol--glycerol-3-phosphate 3-phosphatidyltransferase